MTELEIQLLGEVNSVEELTTNKKIPSGVSL